jgi:hypothetical protein
MSDAGSDIDESSLSEEPPCTGVAVFGSAEMIDYNLLVEGMKHCFFHLPFWDINKKRMVPCGVSFDGKTSVECTDIITGTHDCGVDALAVRFAHDAVLSCTRIPPVTTRQPTANARAKVAAAKCVVLFHNSPMLTFELAICTAAKHFNIPIIKFDTVCGDIQYERCEMIGIEPSHGPISEPMSCVFRATKVEPARPATRAGVEEREKWLRTYDVKPTTTLMVVVHFVSRIEMNHQIKRCDAQLLAAWQKRLAGNFILTGPLIMEKELDEYWFANNERHFVVNIEAPVTE